MAQPMPLPKKLFQHPDAALHHLVDAGNDETSQRQILMLVLESPHATMLLKRLSDIYYVSSCNKQILAYALVTKCEGDFFGNYMHMHADILVSCTDTFETAHQLLQLLSTRFKCPAIPSSIVNEPYWQTHVHELVHIGLKYFGWNFSNISSNTNQRL